MKKIILSLFLALQLACTPLLSLTAQSAPITYEAGISQNAAKKADENKKNRRYPDSIRSECPFDGG